MDKIILKGMEFYGYHGVFKEENKLGQRFKVDVSLFMDLSKAGKTDDLDDTANYADIYKTCKKIVEGKPMKLVEAVAEKISTSILENFSMVERCTICLYKPDPPIPGHYQSVAVEITRGRDDE
ncbi:dihydroneopterin aldolase [Bacillus carboniphilus]|uniref:7,8-dihydroneopterin aldolase n=1 Tax=Bacillus carboniphilus TaxID=86663 RepID=A0ABY9JRB4_9BACI|nr:dihydroneopterin aldolase [Bacillus carboniphilus]WLR41949.1 dihydroneopterin aldolase [Bacillus carboniphilus]